MRHCPNAGPPLVCVGKADWNMSVFMRHNLFFRYVILPDYGQLNTYTRYNRFKSVLLAV